MPLIVIIPGILILALQKQFSGFELPLNANGQTDYNMVLPIMLSKLYPSGILGVGITALIASFMSGMAGNVTAFNTVFTFDIYQTHIKKHASENHYLHVGKATTVVGILLSILTAYVAQRIQQYYGSFAARFQLCKCPFICYFFPRNVLEENQFERSFLGFAYPEPAPLRLLIL